MSSDAALAEGFLQAGIAALRQSRLADAVTELQKAVALDPASAPANANLGVALKGLGRFAEAVSHLNAAAALDPGDPAICYNLGNALAASGDREAAAGAFERAIELNPNFGAAVFNLGNCRREEGRFSEAAVLYRRSIEILPDLARAHVNLAKTLLRLGDFAGAVESARRGVELAPQDAEAYAALASAQWESGNAREAERSARQALALAPGHADAFQTLGISLQAQGRDAEALACFQSFLARSPENAAARSNIGALLNKLERYDEAALQLEEALRLNPRMSMALANLAATRNKQCRLAEGAELARRALALEPNLQIARMQLGYSLHYQGRLSEAMEAYGEILKNNPEDAEASSNLLYLSTYSGSISPREIAARHFEWGDATAWKFPAATTWFNDRDPDRPLRIGYVSPDFRSHSVALFLEPILARHDPRQFHVYAYSNVVRPDAVTARLKSLAREWRDIRGMKDSDAAELIRRDEIDILVDLAGHTSDHRLPIFALKPAPIQISYLGYPCTTGLKSIDYYLTDQRIDPDGAHDDLFSESLLRLARCKLCYRPRRDLPDVDELPVARNGSVTFGSFNNLVKYTPEVLALWSRILLAVPGSRLVLKAQWFRDGATRANFVERFAALGIGQDRVSLIDFDPKMSDIDIALDPFPFNGATTTCHALWMGLPVISLIGNSHSSRVSMSVLRAMNLDELAAESEDAYVAKARELAGNLGQVADWRRTLRLRLLDSPLCDETGFTSELEATYRTIWRKWVAGP